MYCIKFCQRGFVGLELLVFTGILLSSIVIGSVALRQTGSIADIRSSAAGKYCPEFRCPDNTWFGEDKDTPHETCQLREQEACQGHGVVQNQPSTQSTNTNTNSMSCDGPKSAPACKSKNVGDIVPGTCQCLRVDENNCKCVALSGNAVNTQAPNNPQTGTNPAHSVSQSNTTCSDSNTNADGCKNQPIGENFTYNGMCIKCTDGDGNRVCGRKIIKYSPCQAALPTQAPAEVGCPQGYICTDKETARADKLLTQEKQGACSSRFICAKIPPTIMATVPSVSVSSQKVCKTAIGDYAQECIHNEPVVTRCGPNNSGQCLFSGGNQGTQCFCKGAVKPTVNKTETFDECMARMKDFSSCRHLYSTPTPIRQLVEDRYADSTTISTTSLLPECIDVFERTIATVAVNNSGWIPCNKDGVVKYMCPLTKAIDQSNAHCVDIPNDLPDCKSDQGLFGTDKHVMSTKRLPVHRCTINSSIYYECDDGYISQKNDCVALSPRFPAYLENRPTSIPSFKLPTPKPIGNNIPTVQTCGRGVVCADGYKCIQNKCEVIVLPTTPDCIVSQLVATGEVEGSIGCVEVTNPGQNSFLERRIQKYMCPVGQQEVSGRCVVQQDSPVSRTLVTESFKISEGKTCFGNRPCECVDSNNVVYESVVSGEECPPKPVRAGIFSKTQDSQLPIEEPVSDALDVGAFCNPEGRYIFLMNNPSCDRCPNRKYQWVGASALCGPWEAAHPEESSSENIGPLQREIPTSQSDEATSAPESPIVDITVAPLPPSTATSNTPDTSTPYANTSTPEAPQTLTSATQTITQLFSVFQSVINPVKLVIGAFQNIFQSQDAAVIEEVPSTLIQDHSDADTTSLQNPQSISVFDTCTYGYCRCVYGDITVTVQKGQACTWSFDTNNFINRCNDALVQLSPALATECLRQMNLSVDLSVTAKPDFVMFGLACSDSRIRSRYTEECNYMCQESEFSTMYPASCQ